MFDASATSDSSYGLQAESWSSAAAYDASPDEVTGELEVSRELLERLVHEDPEKLLRIMQRADLGPSMLSVAARLLGETPPAHRPAAILALKRLLGHEHAQVREGATEGIRTIAATVPSVLAFIQPEAHGTVNPAPPATAGDPASPGGAGPPERRIDRLWASFHALPEGDDRRARLLDDIQALEIEALGALKRRLARRRPPVRREEVESALLRLRTMRGET